MDKIRKDMFLATKENDQQTKGVAQMIMAAVKNLEIDSGEALNDEKVVELIRKEVKKLIDAMEQFKDADRKDLASINEKQIEYLDQYLPQLMGEEDVRAVVEAKVKELKIESMRDMGRLMGAVMGELKGKADGGMVKDVVQSVLS